MITERTMEETRIKRANGKTYTIMIFSIDGEKYWRVGGYTSERDAIAKELQEACGYPISEYGFSDFGTISGVAYWESREKSIHKE